MTPSSKPKYVAYYRVSTEGQGRSGLGLEAQKDTVERYVSAHGGQVVAAYTEVESGKVNDRPKLAAALLRCRQTRATLLVAKLDRLSRDAVFLHKLRNDGTKFQALDIPDANTLTLGVMIAMAQHERETISARTKAALAARRARGQSLGTPRDMSAYQARASVMGNAVKTSLAQAHATDAVALIEEARSNGCTTLRAIADYMNRQGATSPRGKAWTATAVMRAARRVE